MGGGQAADACGQGRYMKRYLDLHNAARLDMTGDEAKKQVNGGAVMKRASLLDDR